MEIRKKYPLMDYSSCREPYEAFISFKGDLAAKLVAREEEDYIYSPSLDCYYLKRQFMANVVNEYMDIFDIRDLKDHNNHYQRGCNIPQFYDDGIEVTSFASLNKDRHTFKSTTSKEFVKTRVDYKLDKKTFRVSSETSYVLMEHSPEVKEIHTGLKSVQKRLHGNVTDVSLLKAFTYINNMLLMLETRDRKYLFYFLNEDYTICTCNNFIKVPQRRSVDIRCECCGRLIAHSNTYDNAVDYDMMYHGTPILQKDEDEDSEDILDDISEENPDPEVDLDVYDQESYMMDCIFYGR